MMVWTEIRELLTEAWRFARRHRRLFLLGVFAFACAAVVTVQHDEQWLGMVTEPRGRPLRALARWLSTWGDYHTGTLILVLSVAAAGLLFRRPLWLRAALAALLAASFAGLSANVIRAGVGRPRPMADMPDGFYGPNIDYRFQGFPSAHAATSFGTATALLVATPLLGAPTLVVAFGVAWSRMHRRKHHPTDVLIGAAFGALYGAALGAACRRRTMAAPGAPSTASPV